MRKTLKEAVLFANATRTTIEKAKEEQNESMEVLYKAKKRRIGILNTESSKETSLYQEEISLLSNLKKKASCHLTII